MASSRCLAHSGLFNAVGSSSDETKVILSKALSYLGISCIASKRNTIFDSTFEISLSDNATVSAAERIEFDSKTSSWHRMSIPDKSHDDFHVPQETKRDTQDVGEHVAIQEDVDCSISSGIPEDWTTLLPATAHVNFLKSRDWHNTSLGPMTGWSSTLRLMTMKMLADPRPANIYWGRDRVAIYNEPFSIIAASRNPMMMGSTVEEAMPAFYPSLSAAFDEVEKTGVAFSLPEFEASVPKAAGFVEEAWYDEVFSPIRDVDGKFVGLYDSGCEVTERVMAQRNADLIHQIAAGPSLPDTSHWQHIIHVCSKFDRDIPFLVLYNSEEQDTLQSSGPTLSFQGSLGIGTDHPALPNVLKLYDDNEGFRPLLRTAMAKKSSVLLEMTHGRLPGFFRHTDDWRGHGDACTHIVASPLYTSGLLAGFLIIGLNPRRRYDQAHKQFVENFDRVVNSLLTLSITVSEARSREEKLTQELTRRQKFLQQVAEAATVGMYTITSDGLLTWANPIYFDMTGVTPKIEERYNDQNMEYLFHEDQERAREALERCLETRKACTLELRLRKTWQPIESEHDEPCWVMTTITPNVEDDGVIDFLGCITDISHLKWAEKVQIEAAESAKRAKQQQERFIDITSHEMRNPLSAIIQCADDTAKLVHTYVEKTESYTGPPLHEVFESVLDNAKSIMFCAAHQNWIVDDILTVSKLDSSMLVLNPAVINPRSIVSQTIQAFAARMGAEGIQSRFEIQSGFNDLEVALIYIDPSRTVQILINLITNAIKFSKGAQRREICVRMDAQKHRPRIHDPNNRVQWFPTDALRARSDQLLDSDAPEEAVYLMFEVEDSGAGISDEEMTRLFHRFAQATPRTQITYGGSGLGLFISRELVELQGGMIGISSRPGVSTRFAFFVETRKVVSIEDDHPNAQQEKWYESLSSIGEGKPASRSSRVDSDAAVKRPRLESINKSPRSRSPRSWSILLVEDNLINQRVLSKQLQRLGNIVHVANHGMEALEIIKTSKHWASNQSADVEIDVVLMDWEMPIMDGVTCTEQIRKLEAAASITKHLLIIGVTANARPEQVAIAVSAGMDDVVTKPFTVTTLMNRIDSVSK